MTSEQEYRTSKVYFSAAKHESASSSSEAPPPVATSSSESNATAAEFFKRFSSMPFLLWVVVSCMVTQLIVRTFLIGAWFSLLHQAEYTMPKTFAWEIVITFLGSYYDDCIGTAGIQTIQSRNNCLYTFSKAWIPLTGGLIGLVLLIGMVCAFVEIVYARKRFTLWIKLLSIFCLLDTVYCIIAFSHFIAVRANRRDLKDHMKFTLGSIPDQLPSDIYFRWNLSQSSFKCCGVDGPGDWKFSMFRNGDPRFPRSCCNPDANDQKFNCDRRWYPDRYHTHSRGCFELEKNTLSSYENWQLFLHILGVLAAFLQAVVIVQLAVFAKHADSCPEVREIKVTLLRKSFTCRLDQNENRNSRLHSPPCELIAIKEIPSGDGIREDEDDSKTDTDTVVGHYRWKETSV